MNRVIHGPSELDALPVGAAFVDKHGDLGLIDRDETGHVVLYAETGVMSVRRASRYLPMTVVYDPSAPVVPVVSDAAVEAGARALFEEMQELDQENSWDDPLPDEWREAWRDAARETLTAAFPLLGAAPSATREEVGEALHPGLFSLSDYTYARRFDNHGAEARAQHQEAVLAYEVDPLLARFTITPRTDR